MNRFKVFSLCAIWSLILIAPLFAQQAAVPTLGFLSTASPSSRDSDQIIAFHRGLSEAGYTDGGNLKVEYRWASNDYSKLQIFADELVRMQVTVIVAAGGHVTAMAAHNATKVLPIVFTTVTDPVKDGLVASLNKPGGNATGTAGLTSELDAKRLELLRELVPGATLVGALVNPNRPGVDRQVRELQAAADRLGVQLDIQQAATESQISAAFHALASKRVEGLVVAADPFFNNNRTLVVSLATSMSIPAIYQWREFVSAGGLISYGPSITEAYQHAGRVAGQILKGAKPSDIPVVQPATFALTLNRQTASKLGLTVPPSLLSLANEVIE